MKAHQQVIERPTQSETKTDNAASNSRECSENGKYREANHGGGDFAKRRVN
jgi:hypothetical protein